MKPRSFVLFVLAAACLLNAQSAPTLSQSPSDGTSDKQEETKALLACGQMVTDQFAALKIPDARGLRFQGKVSEATALCRGGAQALQFRGTPWVDWGNYWGTGDMTSLPTGFISKKLPAQRGVAGALVDLELQRIELIKFNLFDNSEASLSSCRATMEWPVLQSRCGRRCGFSRATQITKRSVAMEFRFAKAT